MKPDYTAAKFLDLALRQYRISLYLLASDNNVPVSPVGDMARRALL